MPVSLIRPFAGLRPASDRAPEVAAPPYDVLSTEEARQRASGKRWSFLHISKPEIDFEPGIDPYSPAVYDKAAENRRVMKKWVFRGVKRTADATNFCMVETSIILIETVFETTLMASMGRKNAGT